MGKFFNNVFRGIKLALKTVTFHWKQYICFFIALLAMETMFGIIVMSSSKNIDEYEKMVDSKYSWDFAMLNLDEKQREHFVDKYQGMDVGVLDVTYLCTSNSSNDGSGIVYMSIKIKEGSSKSLESAFRDFKADYVSKMPSGDTAPKDIVYQFSPRYTLSEKVMDMRIECAVKLIVLAAVSIAVIILLLNIRLNHFKFTYGIYMSFGADTKKLFSTSFWDMLIIGILMFIPAAAISAFAAYSLFADGVYNAGLITDFLKSHAPNVLFALLFTIPVCIVSVFVPIKITASQPPLKLLVAQDNSNLVSSPRISSQLLGKKFPRAYESLGLFRFRRYVATVVASSVLFASIFTWIAFYSTIYDFNTQQEQAEFDITVDCEKVVGKEYVQSDKMTSVTADYDKVKSYIYSTDPSVTPTKKGAFEKFYTAKYRIEYYESGSHEGTVKTVYTSAGVNVTQDYINARNAVVNDQYKTDSSGAFTHNENAFDKFPEFEEFIRDGNYENGANNPNTKYAQDRESNGYVTAVYQKKTQNTYKYPDNLIKDMQTIERELEAFATEESFTLLKNIDLELFKSDNSDKAENAIASNNVYIAFDNDSVKAFSGLDYNTKIDKRVTNNVKFYPLDSKSFNLDFLSKYDLEILNGETELNLSDMKSNDGTRYIIISETAANSQVLNIKPGDEVEIGYTKEIKGTYDESLRGDDLLDELIRNDEFENPQTYTVYAVIKNMPTSENLPVYLLEDDYQEITGVDSVSNSYSIYLAPDATPNSIKNIHEQLIYMLGDKANVVWNNAVESNRESIDMRNLPVIQTIALFSLILSPLFWFFSQIMFYGKREDEFRMLRGLGATEKEIKKIFQKDARAFTLIGVGATLAISMLGIWLVYRINKLYVAFFNTGALHLYRFDMPWIELGIAVAVTAICAYLSCIIPYRIDRKKAKKALAREFGD